MATVLAGLSDPYGKGSKATGHVLNCPVCFQLMRQESSLLDVLSCSGPTYQELHKAFSEPEPKVSPDPRYKF